MTPSVASNAESSAPHAGLSTATDVWLVRHAEVHAEWRGRAYGDLDVPLSEDGRAETERLARDFAGRHPTEVVSSPLSRALELGRGIAGASDAPLRVEEGLREIHRGSWQGRTVDELPADEVALFHASPWAWRGHGGESDEDVFARAWPVLEDAARRAAGSEVVLVSHYNVIRVLVAHALGIPPSSSFSFRVDPGRAVHLFDAPADAAAPEGRPQTESPPVSGWILRRSNVAAPTAG